MRSLLILLFCPTILAAQNNFSQDWLKCIVELQKTDNNGSLKTHGTGFCLYNYKSTDFTYLVTCAHLLRNSSIYVRIPASDSATKRLGKTKTNIAVEGREWQYDGFSFITKVDLVYNKTFLVNDTLDIGIVRFPYSSIIMMSEIDTVSLVSLTKISNSRIRLKKDVEVGTNIYFVGFPLGIGSSEGYYGIKDFSDVKINPLVRGGIVAWKSDQNNQFLVDGVSYSGNSGSPVFSQIDPFGKYQPSLIGMVLGHLSDLTVREADLNQGLVRCVWIDEILKLKDKIDLLPKN